jgi:peptidoglycan/LPS O-acetylase OafA/YrhL
MPRAKDILDRDDYKNYRNVRAVAVLFIVLGSVLLLGGLVLALSGDPNPQEPMPPAVGFGMAFVGLAGAVGGIAVIRGSRRWAPLTYIMAALYLLGFPVGTILSVVLFKGLSRYLDSFDRVRLANSKALQVVAS